MTKLVFSLRDSNIVQNKFNNGLDSTVSDLGRSNALFEPPRGKTNNVVSEQV